MKIAKKRNRATNDEVCDVRIQLVPQKSGKYLAGNMSASTLVNDIRVSELHAWLEERLDECAEVEDEDQEDQEA